MKKGISLLLILALMLTLTVPVWGIEGDLDWEDMSDLIDVIDDAVEAIPEVENAGSVVSGFQSFLNVAGSVGSVLTLINGSVTFLKLIGLIDDPYASADAQILAQLDAMNEKLDTVDRKLDDMAQQLMQMEATIELNNRGAKAYDMRLAWAKFSQDYVEEGMEKLITQYNAKLATGLMKWCANADMSARNYNGVDNRRLVILYAAGDKGIKSVFTDLAPEAVPEEYKQGGNAYAVLGTDCLPESFSYRADSFRADLAADIAARIAEQLAAENYAAFESYNMPMLTEAGKADATQEAIEALASDAVDALVYRVSSAEINASADFAYEVDRVFTNYCSHLLSSEQGLDAMFKSFYLTHSFEFEVRQDITDFCNRMLLKTGVYGVFVADVLGKSHAAGDSMKETAAKHFYDAGMAIENAKKSAFTGYKNFCYITNTRLYYTTLTLDSAAHFKVYHSGEQTAYRDFSADPIRADYVNLLPDGGKLIGDAKALVLYYTLTTSGYEGRYHDYLRLNICPSDVYDLGPVVTSMGGEQSLPIDDGKVKLRSRTAIGDYFNDSQTVTLKNLPEDASSKYIRYRRQLSGSTLDLTNGGLTVNKPLAAMALYGESHWWWFTDEAEFLGGPVDRGDVDSSAFTSDMQMNHKGYDYTYSYSERSCYAALYSAPIAKLSAGTDGGYDPLAAFDALWQELEDKAAGTAAPPTPVPIPTVSGVKDIDLTGTLWDSRPFTGPALKRACLERIGGTLAESGKSLTEEQKEKLAEQMAALYTQAEERFASDESLYPADPLGLGQNSEALRELAAQVLPDYLVNNSGKASEKVAYVFARVHYRAEPVIRFGENGEPEAALVYEAIPCLLVGETSAGQFGWLTIPLDTAALDTPMTLRLPAEGRVRVRCFDGTETLTELGTRDVTASGGYAEFTAMAGASAFSVEKTADEPAPTPAAVTETGDSARPILYAAVILAAAAGLAVLLLRRKRK